MSKASRTTASSWKVKEGPVPPYRSTERLVKEFTKKLRAPRLRRMKVVGGKLFECPFCNLKVYDVTAHVDQTPQCRRRRSRV